VRVAVVGGGVSGLTVALELARRHHEVFLYERGRVGGLAMGFKYPGFPDIYLDKFYHHIFTTDNEVVRLVEQFGLANDLMWLPSRTGLIAEGRIWPLGGALDLMRFAPLGKLWQWFLMGFNLLHLRRMDDWHSLDGLRCREFFELRKNLVGYRNLWEPLLKRKFADSYDDIPAAFLWGRIHPRSRSRGKDGELLGYLRGGFQRFLDRMTQAFCEAGGTLHTGCPVLGVTQGSNPKVETKQSTQMFDRIVWTASLDRLVRCLQNSPAGFNKKEQAIDYMGVTQLILILKRRQSVYYWLNCIDLDMSFGGIIEHTNLVSPEHYGGEHILYIVNYHRQDDSAFLGKPASVLLDMHLPSLEQVFSEFRVDDILRLYCFHDQHSSPLYNLGFVERIPPYHGWLEGIDFCGMPQVYPIDRSMNYCIANALHYARERYG